MIVLRRGGLLRGTLRWRGGEPIPDASVHVVDAAAKERGEDTDGRETWATTDARGAFESRLAPGRYRVEIEVDRSGRASARTAADVELVEGEVAPFSVELARDGE